jgi:hypothetical protein
MVSGQNAVNVSHRENGAEEQQYISGLKERSLVEPDML